MESTSTASLILSWSYTGVSTEVIPSQHLFYPSIVPSAINVTSTCPFGYSGSNTSSSTICTEIWGDGYRIGTEQCDDGNSLNNDGWDQDCDIETNWVCTGGSSQNSDSCVQCTSGFEQNTNKNKWVLQDNNSQRNYVTVIYILK